MNEDRLLLASTSPRRRQMFAWLMRDFGMVSTDVDETPFAHESPVAYVQRMACEKGQAAAAARERQTAVLAADTIVELDGKILGKPMNDAQAWSMLQSLRDRSHHVYTAIAYLPAEQNTWIQACVAADVPMRDYSDEEIGTYIQSGDPFDKAGAYAIQNGAFHPVKNFNGCFACVMGLPLCHVIRELQSDYPQLPHSAQALCLQHLDYACTISSSVLSFTDQITCCP